MTGEAESPKGMSIEGPYARERNRVEGMTDADRQWRKQYLKDQVLSHNEPRLIPESEQYNPIRRFYRFPLNFIFKKLEPTLGWAAADARYWTGKLLMVGVGVYVLHYYFKYNAHDWTRKKGFYVYSTKKMVYPGDPEYGKVSMKEPSFYNDYGFKEGAAHLHN